MVISDKLLKLWKVDFMNSSFYWIKFWEKWAEISYKDFPISLFIKINEEVDMWMNKNETKLCCSAENSWELLSILLENFFCN